MQKNIGDSKLIFQRENEAKERDMRDLEAFVKKENAERKKETRAIEEARWISTAVYTQYVL